MKISISEKAINAICGEGTSTRGDFRNAIKNDREIPADIWEAVERVADHLRIMALKEEPKMEIGGETIVGDRDDMGDFSIETAEEAEGFSHSYYVLGSIE